MDGVTMRLEELLERWVNQVDREAMEPLRSHELVRQALLNDLGGTFYRYVGGDATPTETSSDPDDSALSDNPVVLRIRRPRLPGTTDQPYVDPGPAYQELLDRVRREEDYSTIDGMTIDEAFAELAKLAKERRHE
jgi:hypothetical protein